MTGSDDAGRGGETVPGSARVTVRAIGGITECETGFDPGVTVLSGRNATNRTSLLTALVGVLGGEAATLRSDADSGEVELSVDGRTHTRRYARQGDAGPVTASGSPLSEEQELVDLFVGLVEDNEARRAVERGEDLRELIMRPVDTGEIRTRIRKRERERERVETELAEIERERSRLPGLEERRRDVESEISELAADLEAVRGAVEEAEASEAEAERAEALLEEIDDCRQELSRIEREVETQRTSLEALREEREEVEAELGELTVEEGAIEGLDGKVDRLRSRKRELEDLVGDLSAVVDVNDDLVSADGPALPGVETGTADPSAALDPMSREVECWTCGSRVRRGAIADRLEELRRVIDEQRAKRDEVAADLEAAEERRAELRDAADRREALEGRLRDIDRQIERREERLDSLGADRERVRSEREALEADLEAVEAPEDDELVEQYRRLSDLEYERGQLDQRLSAVESEIEGIETLAEDRPGLEAHREELSEEIDALRSRIGDLERAAVEQFNDRMADLLDRLGYENLERVWIERRTDPGRGGSATFDLHVVRESAAGAVYEDTVETLSESEREVIGLVVALAGYLVHEVHEEVPFLLLDSLEAIDAERIDALLEYFAEYAPYLVVALLPEDARALETAHDRIPADDLAS